MRVISNSIKCLKKKLLNKSSISHGVFHIRDGNSQPNLIIGLEHRCVTLLTISIRYANINFIFFRNNTKLPKNILKNVF